MTKTIKITIPVAKLLLYLFFILVALTVDMLVTNNIIMPIIMFVCGGIFGALAMLFVIWNELRKK